MPPATVLRRLGKEIKDVQSDKHCGITLEPCNGSSDGTFDDMTHFRGIFAGPPETPYEGGSYAIDIRIPDKYPFQPPTMKFTTKIWHPNVSSQTGAICLDTLSKAWSPILTLKSALISVQSLLASPEPNDPQDAEVANMLMYNPEEFEKMARSWAVKYANAPSGKVTPFKSTAISSDEVTEQTVEAYARQIKMKKQSRRDFSEEAQYRGYNRRMVNQFTEMGFAVPNIVDAFEASGIDRMDGEFYELEEEYHSDIMAHLLGEPLGDE